MNLGGIIRFNKTSIFVLCALLIVLLYFTSNVNNRYLKSKESDRINLRDLLNVAVKVAENGGIEVVQSKDSIEIRKKGLTKEGLVDSVTTADFLSHCSMLKTLRHFYATVTIVSEEAKTVCDEKQNVDFSLPALVNDNVLDEFVEMKDVTIWIDPLDATHEYTEKLYNYVTVMVCVSVKGKPIIGVIHKPFSKATSWAWVNKTRSEDLRGQVYKDGEDNVKIIISRSHRGQIEDILNKNFDKKIDLVIAAGAGYKALKVAKGVVDAYLHITAIKKWDICAGNAVLNSLGGKMTTKYNEEIDYASTSNVVNDRGLIATIKDHNIFLGKL